MPMYKTKLQASKPQRRTVLQWSEDAVDTLRGCFSCTDWSLFHKLDLDEATETITDYINFCVDTIVPKKQILLFFNNKPHITKEVKRCILEKKQAFKSKDKVLIAASQKNLDKMLNQAREKHRGILEESIS